MKDLTFDKYVRPFHTGELPMNNWYKNKRSDKVWWLDNPDRTGEFVFSFDRKTAFNLFADYPWKLTQEQKAIFDAENPYWADFFADRRQDSPV